MNNEISQDIISQFLNKYIFLVKYVFGTSMNTITVGPQSVLGLDNCCRGFQRKYLIHPMHQTFLLIHQAKNLT